MLKNLNGFWNPTPGILLEAMSQVPAPVFFEQSTRLFKVQNLKIKQSVEKKKSPLNFTFSS